MPSHDESPSPRQPIGRDLTKGYLPVAVAIALMIGVSTITYTIGGVMMEFQQDRATTAARFGAIEAQMAKMMAILEMRGCATKETHP